MSKTLLSLLASATLSIGAQAQVELNEIYASHAGTDTEEFIELEGTPNLPLTDYVVLIVEGEGPTPNNGTLDRAWDLSTFTMPADGFFVLGNTAVGPDLDIGASNAIENGSETIYLVKANNATDRATLIGLVGTNIDPDLDLITTIPTLATIVDVIGMSDGGADTLIYDGAAVLGPDSGGFFPAGIFRGNDAKNEWCTHFLDFDNVANANLPRTPGAANVLCCHPDQGSTQGPGTLTLEICGGPLVSTNRVDLSITNGAANQGGILILGDTFVGAPLLGATFGPVPILVSVPVTLDGNGERAIASFLGTNGNLAGITAYIQVIVLEQISPILILGGSNTIKLDFQ